MNFNPGDGTGIVDEINDICQSDNNSFPLTSKARRFNAALDRFFVVVNAYLTRNNWIVDDSNHLDEYGNPSFPIAFTNLIAGRQDYPFPTNLLTIKELFAKDSNSNTLSRLTEETSPLNTFLTPSGNNGTPSKFRLINGSVLLDFIPNQNVENGLKIVFSRSGVRFTATDTTKSPGIPEVYHPYLCRLASIPFLMDHQKASLSSVLKQVGSCDPNDPYYGGDEKMIINLLASRNQTRKPRLGTRQEDDR